MSGVVLGGKNQVRGCWKPARWAALVPETVKFFAMDVSFYFGDAGTGSRWWRHLGSAGNKWSGEAVMLVKPQVEAGARVRVAREGLCGTRLGTGLRWERVREAVVELGGEVLAVIDSPITGMEGNKEFLLWAQFRE